MMMMKMKMKMVAVPAGFCGDSDFLELIVLSFVPSGILNCSNQQVF
jgi:hypothetical protein